MSTFGSYDVDLTPAAQLDSGAVALAWFDDDLIGSTPTSFGSSLDLISDGGTVLGPAGALDLFSDDARRY